MCPSVATGFIRGHIVEGMHLRQFESASLHCCVLHVIGLSTAWCGTSATLTQANLWRSCSETSQPQPSEGTTPAVMEARSRHPWPRCRQFRLDESPPLRFDVTVPLRTSWLHCAPLPRLPTLAWPEPSTIQHLVRRNCSCRTDSSRPNGTQSHRHFAHERTACPSRSLSGMPIP